MTNEPVHGSSDLLSSLEIRLDDEEMAQFLVEIREQRRQRAIRRRNPYAKDLIDALMPYPSGRSRQAVIDEVWERRRASGASRPKSFENTVQSAFNGHCLNSIVYRDRGRPASEALFEAPEPGRWRVRPEAARVWLKARELG